jgi:DNA-binding transcriptional regulator YhcF (GntR family)
MSRPDRSSPVPLYHQIAATLRRRIESGELPPGTSLEPMREAARSLGVNLHTVRHAYAELTRQGLVESRRATGTRVLTRRPGRAEPGRDFGEVVGRTCAELGLSPRELAQRLDAWLREEASGPTLHVVECSRTQCEDLARQIGERWLVDARPWPLELDAPPGAPVVATFFHYNEIRTRWPELLDSVHFLTIRPDPDMLRLAPLRRASGSQRTTVLVCELDRPTLDAVAADLSVLLPPERHRLRAEVVRAPGELLRGRRRAPVLFPPRIWSLLSPEERAHPRALQLRYVFDPRELGALGAELGLRPALGRTG